jgi:hypothetical protein
MWRAAYAPGDGQTSPAYSSQSVQCLCINQLLSFNKLVLLYLLLRLLPQTDIWNKYDLKNMLTACVLWVDNIQPAAVGLSPRDDDEKGAMMMHPQTKRPWSFQPWTLSLSGQYVPRLKLINGFYVPSIFGPWKLHPSQYSPFFGT